MNRLVETRTVRSFGRLCGTEEVIPATRRRAVAREGPWRQRGAALLKRRYRSQEISIDGIVQKRQSNFLFHLFLIFKIICRSHITNVADLTHIECTATATSLKCNVNCLIFFARSVKHEHLRNASPRHSNFSPEFFLKRYFPNGIF